MSDVAVLNLILSAHYLGGGAFGAMSSDIESLINASNRLSRVGAAFKVVGDAMVAAGVAASIGIGAAVKVAAGYEDAINRITAVTPALREHTSLLAQLNAQVGQAGSQYGISPTSVAQGSYYLFSSLGALGKSPAQLLGSNVINDIAAYVRASGWPAEGGVSFSDAAQTLPRLFAAGNVPLNQWGGAMGIMTYLENQAHMTQAQMTSAMTAYLPAMSGLGMSFPDSATLMAAIASSGRVGSPAGREALSALTLMFAGANQQKELNALGLNTGQFFKNGKMLPTDVVMAMLQGGIYSHAKSPADVLSIEHDLFGQVGLRALGPLLSPGGFQKYQNLISGERSLGILNNPKAAELYMRSVSDRMMQAPGAQWDRFKASMELLAITVGSKVIPPLEKLGNMADNIALKLTTFANAHPKLTSALALGAAPGLLGGGLSLRGVGSLLQLMGEKPDVAARLLSPLGMLGRLGGAGRAGVLGIPDMLNKATLRFLPNMRTAAALPWHTLGENREAQTLRGLGMDLGGYAGRANRAMGGVGAAIGRTVAHPIDSLVKPAIKGFGDLLGAILKVGPALAGFAGAALPIVAIVLAIAGAITVGVLLFTKFRAEGQRLGAFFASVFGPIIRQVIATAVQQFHNIQAAWASVQPQLQSGIHGLVNAFISARPAFQLFGTIIGAVFRLVLTVLGSLVTGFIHALPDIIGFFTGILHIVADVSNLVIAIFHGQWGQIPHILLQIGLDALSAIGSGLHAILTLVGSVVGGIVHFFVSLWDQLTGHSIIPDMVADIIKWFLSLGPKVLKAISDLAGNLLKAGQNMMQSLVNGIKSGLGSLTGIMGSVASTITSHIPVVGGLLSHLPHFASGGTMGRSGWAVVGEHGPELVKLPGGANVFSNSDTSRIGNLHVENLHMPGQERQQDPLAHYYLTQYLDAQRQRRMQRYNPDLDALAYQERIGAQYTA